MRLNIESMGKGRDLVFIHGWGMNSAVWESISQEMSNDYRLNLVEMPGHGKSGYGNDCIELDHWVEAVLEVTPRQAVWVGWSLGSMLAQRAALLEPARVLGLVSIAGTPSFVQREGWSNAMEAETLRSFASDLHKDHAQTLERFLLLQAHGDDGMRKLLRPLRQGLASRPQPQDRALEVGLDLLMNVDLRSGLSRLHCPNLWFLGSRDLLVPAAVAVDIKQLQPTAEIEVFQQVAHLPMLSDQDRCLELLKEFMSSIDG